MDYPSGVLRKSQSLAVITIFTALIVGSDYAMAPLADVKLLDSLVFLAAYLFGFRIGASVAVLSEFIWAYGTPWGSPGIIAPFLIAGEVIYALAGTFASRIWAGKLDFRSGTNIAIGGILAVCAFVWDLEVDAVTAVIAYWPALTLPKLLWTMFGPFTLVFTLAHEVSDFVFGAFLIPALIVIIPKFGLGNRFGQEPILAEKKS
ncbi:MAG: hypothetical protein OK436_01455 [Thaumarchaeota archaeon]|nr:hypothetical protein [Nitrososphaerota archaeon]